MNNKYYALKEIPKFKLSTSNIINSFLNEPKILQKLRKYNFVPKIITSFQDYDNLYLVITYYEGQNLKNLFKKIKSEEQIKFISACIIQSLTYLRKEKIINRDVALRNIVMDKNRYLNLIDFSFSINYDDKDNLKYDIVASRLESSPEILNHSQYDYNSDYYRIGVIIYYLIFKKNLNIIKKLTNSYQIILDYKSINNYTSSCIDFLNKLIISDYKKRIGFYNINELKNHSWFRNFDWKKLEKKKINSPLIFKKKKFNKSKCYKFYMYKKKFKNNKFSGKIIENYDYVNSNIIKKILNHLKN